MNTRERLKHEMMNHPSGLVRAGVKFFDTVPEWVKSIHDLPYLLISPDLDVFRKGLCMGLEDLPDVLKGSFRREFENIIRLTVKDSFNFEICKTVFEECGTQFDKDIFSERVSSFVLLQEFPKEGEHHWPSNLKGLNDVGKAFKEHWEGVEGVISSLKELAKYEGEI